MNIAAELSFYPFNERYRNDIDTFIDRLRKYPDVKTESNRFSTIISGSYENVMKVLNTEVKSKMEEEPCIFVMKMAKMG